MQEDPLGIFKHKRKFGKLKIPESKPPQPPTSPPSPPPTSPPPSPPPAKPKLEYPAKSPTSSLVPFGDTIAFILVSNNPGACIDILREFERQKDADFAKVSFIVVAGFELQESFELNCTVINEKEIANSFLWPEVMNYSIDKTDADFISYWSDDVHFNSDFIFDIQSGMDLHRDLHVFPFSRGESNSYVVNFTARRGPRGTYDERRVIVNYGLLRRQSIIDAGMFDEDYKFYCADGDICIRIQRAGGSYRIYKHIKVAHKHMNETHPRGGDARLFASKYNLGALRIPLDKVED